jgi:hypothetical protein
LRDELKNANWHVYGLSEADFDYTINLVETLIESRIKVARQERENLENDPSDAAGEILSDVRYYAWIEAQYLWHFCLWRLQAILEGMITNDFLKLDSDDKLLGLKARLDAMRSAGYSVPQQVYGELLLWANLRNALSHSPPEQFRPFGIDRKDIDEYLRLLKPLVANWRVTQQLSK